MKTRSSQKTNSSPKLRLDKTEEQALHAALVETGIQQAYIFGSRTDHSRRGGDIDLLVYSDTNAFELSRRIATAFFNHCEEKIDVVVINPDQITIEQQAFLNTLKTTPFP